MSFTTTALILTWLAIALVAFALAGVMRRVLALSEGREMGVPRAGPQPGTLAPPLGPRHVWKKDSFLLFVDHGCPSCDEVLPEFESLARHNDAAFVAVFGSDSSGFGSNFVHSIAANHAVFSQYRISALPFALLVNAEGIVMDSAAVGSPSALRSFVLSVRPKEVL